MPEPNDGLIANGGRLGQLREAKLVGREIHCGRPILGGTEHMDTWLDPALFQQMCETDEKVGTAIEKLHRRGYLAGDFAQLHTEIARVFEEVYLPAIIVKFDEVLPTVSAFFAAKRAYQAIAPPQEHIP